QAGEFMAHRQAGEADPFLRVRRAADDEAGAALIVAVEPRADLVTERGDLLQQFARLVRPAIIAQRGDEFDRLAQIAEILLELLRHGCVEHGKLLWPGRKRPGAPGKGGWRPGP